MLHVVKQIERRFPRHANAIAPMLLLVSAFALVVGLALFAGR